MVEILSLTEQLDQLHKQVDPVCFVAACFERAVAFISRFFGVLDKLPLHKDRSDGLLFYTVN